MCFNPRCPILQVTTDRPDQAAQGKRPPTRKKPGERAAAKAAAAAEAADDVAADSYEHSHQDSASDNTTTVCFLCVFISVVRHAILDSHTLAHFPQHSQTDINEPARLSPAMQSHVQMLAVAAQGAKLRNAAEPSSAPMSPAMARTKVNPSSLAASTPAVGSQQAPASAPTAIDPLKEYMAVRSRFHLILEYLLLFYYSSLDVVFIIIYELMMCLFYVGVQQGEAGLCIAATVHFYTARRREGARTYHIHAHTCTHMHTRAKDHGNVIADRHHCHTHVHARTYGQLTMAI